ncbi:ATP-binding protein [Salinibaculum rarum]|uniref:ATP-binding protein n=1 Tax=Salinibaculum rarum TaxID=3058903 RepID=UPI00265E70E5|nr:ATP-binding protein [Salinibaculum sp. KK48]
MSWKAIGGAAIGASIYLARRKNAGREPSSQDGDPSLPRPPANRDSHLAVPRTTSVEPIESPSHAAREVSGSGDESGDTVSGSDSTGGDATPDSKSNSDLVNPLNADLTEEEQPEGLAPQDGCYHEGEIGDSTGDLTESPLDTDDHQYDWVTETGVNMADVGGMDEVKAELRQDVIRPMKEGPEKAEKFDIPLPNVLFYGPPGTGKTYLAQALATEIGFPFVNLSGSDVTSKWVNESADRIGQLFDEAEELAEEAGGAVIFLDELDAVLPERQMDSHGEDRKVVNEFLSHLQESARDRVLFIGATNERDHLDNAATRNGRIDKEIFVGQPDYDARKEIIDVQLTGRPNSLSDADIERLARATEGAVAADIQAIVTQAARNAAFGRGGDEIEVGDFERLAR